LGGIDLAGPEIGSAVNVPTVKPDASECDLAYADQCRIGRVRRAAIPSIRPGVDLAEEERKGAITAWAEAMAAEPMVSKLNRLKVLSRIVEIRT